MAATVAMPVMAASPVVSGLEKIIRRHAVKLSSPAGVSVEECMKNASRMNSMVVVFVDNTEKADELVVAGVIINGVLMPVFPLSNPFKKVLVSNITERPKNSPGGGGASRAGGGPTVDHLDLRSERLTRELVEQTATRLAETMEDAVGEENCIKVSIKRKNTDTKYVHVAFRTNRTLQDQDTQPPHHNAHKICTTHLTHISHRTHTG